MNSRNVILRALQSIAMAGSLVLCTSMAATLAFATQSPSCPPPGGFACGPGTCPKLFSCTYNDAPGTTIGCMCQTAALPPVEK